MQSYANSDHHREKRSGASTYEVRTISLVDLLALYKAPSVIDYLSIDTEGSELDILSAFDFSKYTVRLITVEHNYTSNRESIHALLARHGYHRVFSELSAWDDWYILE